MIDPKQGYLFQWNNVPSMGWTEGDSPARERATSSLHRARLLGAVVRKAAKDGGGYDRTAAVDRVTGTTAQQRPPLGSALRRARRGAGPEAAAVLDTILRWNGSYASTDGEGKVDPGLAAFEALKAAAIKIHLGRLPAEGLKAVEGGQSSSHEFDITNLQSYSLRHMKPRAYRQAAKLAFRSLAAKYGSEDPAKWREPRLMYEPSAQGAGSFEPFPFFDRGTVQMVVDLRP